MTIPTTGFLGVERSLGGRRWCLRPGDERDAVALSQRFGLPELVGRVLAARGIGLDDAESFLSPTLKILLPDPSHLIDMDKAAARLVAAITAGQPVGVFGDYDVDGATSSALLANFLRAVGAIAEIHIPDRIVEGYGPNAPALRALLAKGCRVVVTVDCGTTAFAALAEAAQAGIDVIVVDHHEAEAALPTAFAVVNPNRLDETSPHGHLAAVGVTFLLAVALNRALKEAGWYANHPAPDLLQWLDLVALGTVCDVVPLIGVNRALVTQGLKVMARRGNIGLAALSDVAAIREKPDALLPTMGGQTALNTAMQLHASGALARHGVELIGAKADVIDRAEDRLKFRDAMAEIGIESPRSQIAHTMAEAREALAVIGLPAVIRPSFTLGGTGGGIAYNKEEFEEIVSGGLEASPTTEVLIEESVLGWKEYEMEVVRDSADNCIIICAIENVDPMGIHTGDSVTVAPALTLTDKEYQIMRDASIACLRKIGVDTGGSNVQFAVNPANGRLTVIEMNPRVSRSSALASKATGFPIAKIAAKLAVGYTLDELANDITRTTPASFERPSTMWW